MSTYYSNGKLLLTGEYLVLDGATALAIPTKFGQDLTVDTIEEPQLVWESYSHDGTCWFEAVFDLPKLRLVNATFNSKKDGSTEFIAETLQDILQEGRVLNPEFLNSEQGFLVKTNLTFPRDWGLGSSSTLINNIAQWAKVDGYQLLWNAFSGSGYDIACAQNNSAILYRLDQKKPVVSEIKFDPSFKEQLFFVHLNQKQDSREGIAQYKEYSEVLEVAIERISKLTDQFIKASNIKEFEELMEEHEQLISEIIKQQPIKERLFTDYFGAIKSLGAWGGDFILATGNESTPAYFKEKGYQTVLRYKDMIL
ncbi:GYDIA family GHMP kinase [Flavobacteriaceae bacterium S356]|uniref:GYDIA family GHMP kinase n=1 Tax=Asprobacillus argus TaxID=3076534 RepID=A0ABU3LEY5_9FLAO|nr:GYDIA family GHMP kinase [Flavobacteriaceae bacterium S356]